MYIRQFVHWGAHLYHFLPSQLPVSALDAQTAAGIWQSHYQNSTTRRRRRKKDYRFIARRSVHLRTDFIGVTRNIPEWCTHKDRTVHKASPKYPASLSIKKLRIISTKTVIFHIICAFYRTSILLDRPYQPEARLNIQSIKLLLPCGSLFNGSQRYASSLCAWSKDHLWFRILAHGAESITAASTIIIISLSWKDFL